MNFNTANNTFRQLMGNGLLYRVPHYQRNIASRQSWMANRAATIWKISL